MKGSKDLSRESSELKEVKNRLWECESRYHTLFDQSRDAIAIVALDGTFIDFNQSMSDIFGYSREELIGMNITEIYINPADRGIFQQEIERKGSVKDYEVKLRKKDGTEMNCLFTTTMKRAKDGSVLRYQGIIRDVTARKKAEDKLDHINLVLRAIRNVNQLITKEKNRDKLLKGICNNLVATNGYHSAWIILLNRSGKLLAHAEAGLGKDFLPMVKRLKRGEMTVCCRRALRQSDALVIKDPLSTCTDCPLAKSYHSAGAMTIRLAQSRNIYGILNVSIPADFIIEKEEQYLIKEVAEDIAFGLRSIELDEERKRGQEELELRAQLLDSATDSIFLHNFEGNFIYVNETACRAHGYSREEFMKMKLQQVIAPERVSRIDSDFQEMLERGQVIFESAHLRKDGSIVPVEVNGRVIESGGRKLLLTVIRDITERKQAEEEREALLEDLRTLNYKLEQSNKELQDFVYVASHDLQEPLRKISSFGILLQDSLQGKLDEDQQENFEYMIDGAKRMQMMIGDLLDYSRVTTRAKPFERVDLNKVIEDLKSLELATLVDETRGAIYVPEPLPPVRGDPSQVYRLLQNLIGNGLKFHQEGIPPKITISARRTKDNMLHIQVQDNGIGIDAKYHEQVFTMFKRLHSRKRYKGTGIGLAICKKIVNRHRGDIGVKSTPGEGSTFWFTLPRVSYSKDD